MAFSDAFSLMSQYIDAGFFLRQPKIRSASTLNAHFQDTPGVNVTLRSGPLEKISLTPLIWSQLVNDLFLRMVKSCVIRKVL